MTVADWIPGRRSSEALNMTLKRYGNLFRTIPAARWCMVLAFLGCLLVPVQACTIFVLTEDYTADVWKEIAPEQEKIQADLKRLGNLVSLTLVERSNEDGRRSYRYRMEFEKITVLQHIVFDRQNKVALSESEDAVWKPRTGKDPR